jgi:hypothetical protein
MSENSTTYNRILSKGIEADLPGIKNGMLRFTTDTGRLFLDNGSTRIEITDFVKGKTKEQVLNTLAPLPKIYLTSDTHEFYIYDNGWHGIEATNAVNASSATYASTASYSTNSSSASYATNSATSTYAGSAGSATNASSATYATNAGSATSATNASTASYATNSGTASFASSATNAGSATNASTANVSNDAVKTITRSGTTFTVERKDGSTFTFTQQDNDTTYAVVSTTANGLAPKVTSTSGFLKGDGTWATPTNTTYAAGAGIGLNSGTFTNTGVREVGINGSSVNVNTNGSTVNLLIPYATNSSTAEYAKNAGTAARATSDGSGNTITSTYAPKASPVFTGTPTTPDVTAGDKSGKIANTKFVDNAITTAIAGVTQFDYEVVSALPETGVKGKIYLIAVSSPQTDNYYDEYIWIGTKYEKLGTTQLDLSNYINTVSESGTGNAYTSFTKSGNTLTLTKGSTFLTSIPNYYATTATYTGGTGITKTGTAFSINTGAALNLNASTVAYAGSAGSATNASTADYGKNAISNITRSGLTFTATRFDGSTFTFTQKDDNTTYTTFTSAAAGLAPASGGGTTKYLRADGSWQVPPDNNTTYDVASVGSAGLMPGLNGYSDQFLTGIGTWETPIGTTYGVATIGSAGLMPGLNGYSDQFLTGTGTWATPTNTTYTNATTAAAGLFQY